MKKIVSVILSLIICISVLSMPVLAKNQRDFTRENELAIELKTLGLFNGVSENDFELDRMPSRVESIVMLIRLIGKESDALNSNYEHPFDDVPMWADKYIGYAYKMGLTKGASATKFGTENANSAMYITFVLRALGYSDGNGRDFTWDNPYSLAKSKKIISDNVNIDEFLRADVVSVSHNSLFATLKNSTQTLANKLLFEDVFSTDQLDDTHNGKLMLAADMPDFISEGVYVDNLDDLYDLIILSYRNFQLGIGIKCPGYSYEELLAVFEKTKKDPIFHDQIYSYPSCNGWNGYIKPHLNVDTPVMMQLYYENPKRYEKSYKIYREDLWYGEKEFSLGIYDLHAWVEKIESIIKNIIKPNMSETEKVKAIYDYICKNTKYDAGYENSAFMTPHFAENVIFKGHGVCDGYATAFKILCNAVGIECVIPKGFSSKSGHAWNQAKVDGKWYNFDVCWGDTMYSNRISYDFFGKSDNVFAKDGHQVYKLNVSKYECNESLYY